MQKKIKIYYSCKWEAQSEFQVNYIRVATNKSIKPKKESCLAVVKQKKSPKKKERKC